MYEYHDQYKRSWERGDVDAQARWARQLTWEIARHAVGEEIVMYPLMERYLGEKGKQLADHDREEHLVSSHFSTRTAATTHLRRQQVKQELYKLESLSPGTDEYHTLITRMMTALHHHNDDEEIKDLPLLEPAIGKEASKRAAQEFKTTKKLAPTRYTTYCPHRLK